ncbi:MAG: class I SAM-dependent methyltransferase [Trueperaceae bacterium]|nr:class I SAM-dependent methyltransferase [Trueperaceae bacterium]
MPVSDWIDVEALPFETLLLLEDPHLHWLPRDWPGNELGVALRAHPSVGDFLRVRLRGAGGWLEALVEGAPEVDAATLRRCEVAVMARMADWLVYVVRPEAYDAQPFLRWSDEELLGLVDPRGKVVLDVGSGTGRLLEPLIADAATVFAVEPIAHLRGYLKTKFAAHAGKLFVIDGLLTEISLPDGTADVTVAGHVYGDEPEREIAELERVTRPGGIVILCPGTNDVDDDGHRALLAAGYAWSTFEEPGDGRKRKYWRTLGVPPERTVGVPPERTVGVPPERTVGAAPGPRPGGEPRP